MIVVTTPDVTDRPIEKTLGLVRGNNDVADKRVQREIEMRRLALTVMMPILLQVGFNPIVEPRNVLGQQPSAQDGARSTATKFVDLLSKGEFEQATAGFDATMTKALSAGQLQAVWQGIIREVGGFENRGTVRLQKAAGYEIVLVTCKFKQGQRDAKVVIDKQKKIAGLFFVPTSIRKPPTYANPAKFTETDVTIGADPWKLPATITIPIGSGRFPAVVLVHGSGPQDRDVTIGPNKVFQDLAWGLATKGVVVLRYEKRTLAHQIDTKELTVKEETVEDAVAAARSLVTHPSVDTQRIFVIGHSLGGYLIPRIADADESGAIAGYISLAGSTRPTEDLILEQTRYILGLDGSLSADDESVLTKLKEKVDAVKSLEPDSEKENVLGAPTSYWLDLRGYSPAQEAKKMSSPLLVLQGERDYQVTMKDFANWKNGLKDRENVTFKSYPDLNHLLMAVGKGMSTPQEYEVASNVSEEVVSDLVAWMEKQ